MKIILLPDDILPRTFIVHSLNLPNPKMSFGDPGCGLINRPTIL